MKEFTPPPPSDINAPTLPGNDQPIQPRPASEPVDPAPLSKELNEIREQLGFVLESIKDYALMLLDVNGTVTGWSAGAERILGFTESEILGEAVSRIFTPEDVAAGIHAREMKLSQNDGRATDDRWHLRKDGSRFWASGYMRPLFLFIGDKKELRGFAKLIRELTESKLADERIRSLNEILETRNSELIQINNDWANLMGNVNVPLVILDKDHRIRRLSPAAESAVHIAPGDIGKSIYDVPISFSLPNLRALLLSTETQAAGQQLEIQNASGHWYNLRAERYKTEQGKFEGVVLSFSDIQAAKERQAAAAEWSASLEMRVKQRTDELIMTQNALHQAEKLEAIGRLAGGVAHDFNNLMTGILGIAEDLRRDLGKDSVHQESLQDILSAARKAAVITKQLLAFGRRQVVNPKVLNINQMINSMDGLFRRLLGEDIEVKTILEKSVGSIYIDPGSLEQVILNLGLNARDAMASGGRLTLETKNVELGEEYVQRYFAVPPGAYVELKVSDTGAGMERSTIDHIFEPFFSTKGDKGTGLGLANVYGIIKQARGDIAVDSVVGRGTVFRIYLPRVGPLATHNRRASDVGEAAGGDETILVVEDEDIVRKVAVRALRKKGYQVLHARNAEEAIQVSKRHADSIHLLLTDVIMPGLNGHELALKLVAQSPTMAVLYMSGYNREIMAQRGILTEGTNFIEKTFTSEALCHKVRDLLNAPPSPETRPAKDGASSD